MTKRGGRKMDKYLNLARELKTFGKIQMTVIPILARKRKMEKICINRETKKTKTKHNKTRQNKQTKNKLLIYIYIF